MRATVFLSVFVLATGCVSSPKGDDDTTSGAVNQSAPYIWSNYSSAKTLQISNDFTNDEVSNITAMATAWKTSVEDKKTFFSFGARVGEITTGLTNLDTMLDSTLGVYKATSWHTDLPASALAVTQIYGRRRNVGTANEFVDIEHADILVNYDWHNFDTADTGPDYDLRTVMLHEMGHFIGLQHKASTSNRNNSVMYPSISTSEAKRGPKAIDIADVAEKYDITLDNGGVVAAIVADKKKIDTRFDPNEAAPPVKIQIELHADGECVHKENGVLVGRHPANLKK